MAGSSSAKKTQASTSTNPQTKEDAAYVFHSQKIKELEGKVTLLENQMKPEESYFRSAKKINKTSLIIFLILPILQLAITLTLLIIFCETNDTFIEIAKWIVGVIGIGTFIELFYVPYRLKAIEDKIEKIEKK